MVKNGTAMADGRCDVVGSGEWEIGDSGVWYQ